MTNFLYFNPRMKNLEVILCDGENYKVEFKESADKSPKLKSKGLIERVGPDKGGYWRVKV